MKLVVGLGNPGEKYKNNRHNVGFMVVDKLAEGKWQKSKSTGALITWIKGGSVELVKPQEYMNKSGVTLKGILKKHPQLKVEDIYVVYDDLDIKLGEYKISLKGPKDHNGLNNIYEQVGRGFTHIRVGVDARHSPSKPSKEWISGEEYVLSNWLASERKIVSEVIGEIVEELKDVLA